MQYIMWAAWLQGHLQSLETEKSQSQLGELVPNLSTHVSGSVDWQYLQQAQCTLLECRRVLSNAYVFSFFMFEPANFEQVRRGACVLRGACYAVTKQYHCTQCSTSPRIADL